MIFTVQNLGAIKKAEIDIKPFTIFIGPNNSQKSWTAYALSTLIGPYAIKGHIEACVTEKASPYPPLDDAIRKIEEQGTATIDLIEFISTYGIVYINKIAESAPNCLQEFMATKKVSFENLKMKLDFSRDQYDLSHHISTLAFEENLVFGKQNKPLLTASKEKENSKLYFYTSGKGSILDEIPARVVKKFVINSVFNVLHRAYIHSEFPYVRIFPAERTGYATFSLNALDFQETLESEIHLREKSPKPFSVVSFDSMIMEAFQSGSIIKRAEEAKNEPLIQTYIELANILGSGILGGKTDFTTPEPAPWRELLYEATDKIQLDMPVVSSMVKELSSLVLYLRYLAKPNEMIIIDEPEMNLHPKAQVQLTEFLAMLVNAGLKVLITTHSPYIVDHTINLMKAARKKSKKAVQELFYLKDQRAFIPMKNVSVYLFDQGTARNILNKKGEIDWQTFSKISDEITDLYFNMDEVK